MVEGRLAAVDEQAGPHQRFVVCLTHVEPIRADQIEMLPWPQPLPADDRLGGHRGTGHDVGGGDRLSQVDCDSRVGVHIRQATGSLGGSVPHHELGAREDGPIGLAQGPTDRPRPDDENLRGLRVSQPRGGQDAVAGGLPLGDEMEIDDRLEGPVDVRIEAHTTIDRWDVRILREDGGGFDCHAEPVDPGRAGEEGVLAPAQHAVSDLCLGKSVPSVERVDDALPGQQLLGLDGNDLHTHETDLRRDNDRRAGMTRERYRPLAAETRSQEAACGLACHIPPRGI